MEASSILHSGVVLFNRDCCGNVRHHRVANYALSHIKMQSTQRH